MSCHKQLALNLRLWVYSTALVTTGVGRQLALNLRLWVYSTALVTVALGILF